MGTVFTGLDIAQGARPTPQAFAVNIVGIYSYHALQCPMVQIQGRESALHNFASGATLGYLGVQSGRLGVPFVHPSMLYNMRVPPAFVGAAVYGGMGFAFAFFGGKRI